MTISSGNNTIPSDYNGLVFWCDADSGLASLSNGDPISTWNATVGSNPTQTGKARPSKNVVDGKTVAVFSSHSMVLGANLDPSNDYTLFCKIYRATSTDRVPVVGNFSFEGPAFYLHNNGVLFHSSATRYTAAGIAGVNGWKSCIGTSSGSSMATYLNGTSLTLISNTAASYPNPINGIGISRSDRGAFSLRSIGWYNRVLNPTEISGLNNYLMNL